MKKTNNLASKFALAAFFALGALAVTSCNKDNNESGQELPAGNSQIIVRIAGISDGDNNNSKGSKSSTSNHKTSSEKSIELVSGNGFDAVVAVDNQVPSTSKTPSLRAANGTSVSSNMAAGTKYRLFLYKKEGATYTYDNSYEFTVGQETPIQVKKGVSYKWVALSYNNKEAVADRGADDQLLLPENKDVLFASSTADLTIGDNTSPINITFNRLFSRIGIELNTKGMFGPMNSATVTVTGHSTKTATVDLTTGALVLAQAAHTPEISFASFINTSEGDASQKIAYYYTADETPQAIKVVVKDLSIKLDNGTNRVFSTSTLSQTQAISPERGKNHRLLLGLTESALTRDGVQWSRSNLYYKAGDATPYRFNPTNDFNAIADPRAYFSFKGHLPMTLASNDPKKQKDPCALVYPAGLWKTPTAAQVGAVTSRAGLLGDLLGGVLDLVLPSKTPGTSENNKALEYAGATGANPAYGDAQNTLRFNYNGSQTKVSVLSDLVSLNLGNTQGKHAAFWSSSELIDLSLLGTGVGAQSFIGYKASGLLGSATIASTGVGLLNINLLGLDVISSELMNVRCVRDESWNIASVLPGYNPEPAL
ncbi:hypothetical protein [Sphingobacterium anhuiense]|uniref:hypothetical protein n=1 Tax=Sphingobacterium anhuiense TaxID=493780 RepID=UPI003C2DBBEF